MTAAPAEWAELVSLVNIAGFGLLERYGPAGARVDPEVGVVPDLADLDCGNIQVAVGSNPSRREDPRHRGVVVEVLSATQPHGAVALRIAGEAPR